MKKIMDENKDVVKKKINSYFKLIILFLIFCKEELMKSVDVKILDDL